MSAQPLVTVMIPAYSQAAYLEQAVESALAQTYPNLEVIVCDDASPDDSVARLARFADQRLRVVCNARNLGRVGNYRRLLYELARGDYVVNLDGDDYFTDPGFIAAAVPFFEADDDCVIVAAQATTDGRVSAGASASRIRGLDFLWQLPRTAAHLSHLSTIFRREKALPLDFYRSPVLSSDWESLYRLAAHGNVVRMERSVALWRQHDNNATATTDSQKLLDNLQIWAAIATTARAAGMGGLRAALMRVRCEAHFFAAACVALSRDAGWDASRFMRAALKQFRFRTLAWLLHAPSSLRILLSLAGYYRWRKKVK